MGILYESIKQMSIDEVKQFKIYASRASQNKDSRKDLALFDLYRKGMAQDDDLAARKIYGAEDTKAFARLKNRLGEEISKSLIINAFDDKNVDGLLKFALYRYHYDKSRYVLALRMLRQSQKRALEQNDYELLDMVYSAMIKLSREFPEIDPEVMIKNRVENEKKLRLAKQIDDLLALLNHRLRISQGLGKKNTAEGSREALRLIREFRRNPSFVEVRTLSMRMHKTVSRYFIENRDYESLVDYLQKNRDEIRASPENKQETETAVELMIYLVNALNGTRRFDLVPQYTSELTDMLEHAGKEVWKKFAYFSYQPLVYMYSEQRMHEKALRILEEMEERKISGLNPTYELFTVMNKAICKYELTRYKEAARHLGEIQRSKAYKNLDNRFRLKIEIADLIIRIADGDYKYLEVRLPQVIKDYNKTADITQVEHNLLELFQIILKTPNFRTDKKALALARELLYTPLADQPIIDYSIWIKSVFRLK